MILKYLLYQLLIAQQSSCVLQFKSNFFVKQNKTKKHLKRKNPVCFYSITSSSGHLQIFGVLFS